MDITERVREFVVENFLLGEGEKLKNDASFLAEGIIDSTGILELVSLVEEVYAIEVGDDELIPENFDSIDRITRYIGRKLNGSEVTDKLAICKKNEEVKR